MKQYQLVCSVCGTPIYEEPPCRCPKCHAPAEPLIDVLEDPERSRSVIEGGCNKVVWDYADLLPVEGAVPVTLGEGNTPLLKADRLGEEYGFGSLWLKNETLNPTSTYKDRFAAVALTIEKDRGARAVALGSAGNAANAVAAFATKAGLKCFVFLPPGAVAERGFQIRSYGAQLLRCEYTTADCNAMAEECEKIYGWKSLGTIMIGNPLACEGYKTMGYEIGKQLGFRAPDWIVVPTGGGALFSKVFKAFEDMKKLGMIDKLPHMVSAQAEGCSPFVDAWERDLDEAEDWPTIPDTCAFAIADVIPFDSRKVIDIYRKTGGRAVSATDPEIITAMQELARREAVIAEPSSACAFAVAKKLRAKGVIGPDESVVCVLTGSGLRDLRLFAEYQTDPVPYFARPDFDLIRPTIDAYLAK